MTNLYPNSITEKIGRYSPDMLCAIDKDGRFVQVSQACKHLLGYEPHELEGKRYLDVISPEDKAAAMEIAQNVIQGGYTASDIENRYVQKNGKKVWIMWSVTWSEEDQLMLCIARDVTGRKSNSIKANEGEQQYRALFDHHPDLIFSENRAGIVTQVNDSFCRELGCDRDKVLRQPATSFLPADMANVNKMSLQQALLGSTLRYDVTLADQNQELRVFDTVKFPLIENEEIVGAQTILKDITPIVRSYELIEQQAKKLHHMLESITDAFFSLDKDWRFTYVNSVYAAHEGCRKEELLGKNIWEKFPQAVSTVFFRQCKEAASSGLSCHFEETFPHSGTTYRFKIYPSAEGLSVYFTDFTREKKLHEELEKLSLVASHTDNGVIITDAHGVTEWVNEGFTKMTGYTLADIAGKKPGQILAGKETDAATTQQIDQTLKHSIAFTTELVNYKKSGEKFWTSLDITPVYNEAGSVTRFIGIQKDISSRMEARANVLQMTEDLHAQNAALQQFTYIVSHNLRAPVANALGLANLLARLDKNSRAFDTTLTYLEKSITEIDTVLKDVNTILSIRNRQQVLETEQIPLAAILEQAYLLLQETLLDCGGELEVKISNDRTIKANRAYLYSIFYNLLSNAIIYRSPERPLRVQVACHDSPEGGVLISVSDNGMGFDTKQAGQHIFKLYQKFHQEAKGRGFGLFLVKKHVEAMGGTIEVSSQVNVGTSVQIYLP
ncbi:PAS domain-containing sensor histidine kinase [Pontibacter liquoris]|uniref:PAS domain-containing sensor histidine kinase n=1 Tax=Pontibacter liquoris TaxID=2905677 RepID=UPI001FA75423|nr:PAS domain-containing sensor histidine kinase [Pontibacter liquoris]